MALSDNDQTEAMHQKFRNVVTAYFPEWAISPTSPSHIVNIHHKTNRLWRAYLRLEKSKGRFKAMPPVMTPGGRRVEGESWRDEQTPSIMFSMEKSEEAIARDIKNRFVEPMTSWIKSVEETLGSRDRAAGAHATTYRRLHDVLNCDFPLIPDDSVSLDASSMEHRSSISVWVNDVRMVSSIRDVAEGIFDVSLEGLSLADVLVISTFLKARKTGKTSLYDDLHEKFSQSLVAATLAV